MTIRAVIFDIGGVLLRTEDQSGRRKLEQHFGMQTGEIADLVFGSDAAAAATIGEQPERAVWEHVRQTLKLNAAELEDLRQDFWSGDRLDMQLVQFMRDLHRRIKVGILSNAWDGARAAVVDKFRLGEVTDTVVISAEEHLAKPDPRIFRLAAERLDVHPDEAIFVDDVLENVQAARSVGMQGVQFKNTAQTIAEITKQLGSD